MSVYLMIQNEGVAPVESFTLLGASTKRGSTNSRTIGVFGSGSKMGVNVCLRHGLAPVVFCGNLKLEFGTRARQVNTGISQHEFSQVFVKYSGKDSTTGRTKNSTEDMSFVLEYGANDWVSADLAAREFVANALDRSEEQADYTFWQKFCQTRGYKNQDEINSEVMKEYNDLFLDFRAKVQPWSAVSVEIVSENQVRAKSDHTRVFIPCNDDILRFHSKIGAWFLHFSEPESLTKSILPKKNRNIGPKSHAVIYKKGVRIRECAYPDNESLFDYNLDHLTLDESRVAQDSTVMAYAGKAMADANVDVLAKVLASFGGNTTYFEHSFQDYYLKPQWNDNTEVTAARTLAWKKAFDKIAGENGVIAPKGQGDIAEKRGYKVVNVPESFVRAAEAYGIATIDKVLSDDDKKGREIIEATPTAIAAVDWVWNLLEMADATQGKPKPQVKCYRSTTVDSIGFYREGIVHFNVGYVDVAEPSSQLLSSALEECAHYITHFIDESRQFQTYFMDLVVKLGRAF